MLGYRKTLWSFLPLRLTTQVVAAGKVLLVMSLFLTCPLVLAETWHLDQAEDW